MAQTAQTLQTSTAIPAPVRAVRLSDEQLAIVSAVQTGKGNLLVRARAGTGKTYLLRQCVPIMHGEIAIAAYNRKIAKEIDAKLQDDGAKVRTWSDILNQREGVDVDTFHAFGWRVVRQALKGVRLEGAGQKGAGFMKFDLIAERLKISKTFAPLVRRAMERAQERLLELPQATEEDKHATAHALVVNFLNGLVAFEKPQWREQMQSIAKWYETHGYLTEAQLRSARLGARNAKQSMPKELRVGRENALLPKATAAQQTVEGTLDQAWIDLAHHHAFHLDLPADDHIEMQLLRNEMRTDDLDAVRDEALRRCLVKAAEAIHLSAKMAMETFRAVRHVKGRQIEGEEFTGVISFGEMLYLPIYLNLTIPQYDFVCVDEAQDSNPARREFARRMMKANGRIIFVGDDRQAIYGWAGADNDALDQIIEQFRCIVFPMTTTFRCGKAIVALAQKLVPDYRAADTNPEGKVEYTDEAMFHQMEMRMTDAVICRNTAPLVKTAYKLLARGIACHVEGREIGKKLMALLERWSNIQNLSRYVERLKEYRDTEVAKLLQQNAEVAVEEFNDRVDTILAIIEVMPKGSKMADVKERVESLFADTADGETPQNVTLISAHKSKGLEFDRVFGLGVSKYMPSPYAKQEWQMKQEENLEYVLKTRAINEYIEVMVA